MCFGGSSTPKVADPPPAPNRAAVQPSVQEQRRRISTQSGQYGNVFTSVLGDPGYGASTQPTAQPTAG